MANTVFVGLSGGVDSAVSAALLKAQKIPVTGVFIKIWQPEFFECTWQQDRLDAMRVAASLEIPFRELDLSDRYKKEVIADMLSSYQRGMTPNPDVLCNRAIKFGAFAEWARTEGADAVATGHYARTRSAVDTTELLRGRDREKDQSYFLHLLNARDLARAVFPIGEYTKSQVRAKARSYGLPVAQKHDSQGLCFVGDVSMPEFLKRYIEVEDGTVRDMAGKKIGRHHGAALYTIGQRHGFEIQSGTSHGPYYVVRINPEQNEIIVSPEKDRGARTTARIEKMHWVNGVPKESKKFEIQTRYRESPVSATIAPQGSGARVDFDTPHLFSPGQSLVAYEGDVVRGGGIIARDA